MMKSRYYAAFAISALIAFGASDIAAQVESRGTRGPRGGPDVEVVMSLRDRLELTDAQLADLEAMRRETVDTRNAQRAEMEEMRSRLRAGEIRRSEMMAFMEDRAEVGAATSADRRARLEAILTEVQLEALQASAPRVRRGAEGVRGGRQMRRGSGRADIGFRQGQRMRNRDDVRPDVRRGLRRGPRVDDGVRAPGVIREEGTDDVGGSESR